MARADLRVHPLFLSIIPYIAGGLTIRAAAGGNIILHFHFVYPLTAAGGTVGAVFVCVINRC